LILVALFLGACSSTHRFEISSDEPIESVSGIFKNARKVDVLQESDTKAVVTAQSADDSGEIKVGLRSNSLVTCPVGYVTSGDAEPHQITIRNGRCRGI
jgi:hypothetical protein